MSGYYIITHSKSETQQQEECMISSIVLLLTLIRHTMGNKFMIIKNNISMMIK